MADAAAVDTATLVASALPPRVPNLYKVSGDGITVTYSTSTFLGGPHLTYQDGTITRTFSGSQIKVTTDPSLGTIVSVVILLTVDTGSTSFSLLIPRVNLIGSNQADISTYGITTQHKFSIRPMPGQQDDYVAHQLKGTAAFVFF